MGAGQGNHQDPRAFVLPFRFSGRGKMLTGGLRDSYGRDDCLSYPGSYKGIGEESWRLPRPSGLE